MTIPVDIRQVLVCDDIRREDNGKVLFIGTYVGSIQVLQFPATLRLCFWLQGRRVDSSRHTFNARFRLTRDGLVEAEAGDSRETEFTVEGTSEQYTHVAVAVIGVPFEALGPGDLIVEVQDNRAWTEVDRLRVTALPSRNGVAMNAVVGNDLSVG